MNPMLLFRGDSLAPGMIQQEKSWSMRLLLRAIGPFFFKRYPYEEMYFLEHAQRIRDRVLCGVCYIGGVCLFESLLEGCSVELRCCSPTRSSGNHRP